METFTIQPNDCLKTQIDAWYNSEYYGGQNRHKCPGTIENIICVLKNDFGYRSDQELKTATDTIYNIILDDLSTIKSYIGNNLTVCVVPRSKVNLNSSQLKFKETVKNIVNALDLDDGTDYIMRIQNTRTTHNGDYGGDGPLPYEGITMDTCTISDDVKGKTILLIDDVYTPSVNIDEDAIQALLDKGASKVYFYAVGHTF